MLTPEAVNAFPRDLLDGSRETVRMAERIVRQMGFTDYEPASNGIPRERLAWAILALEEGEPESDDQPDPQPGA